jgi:hypothetical protein
MMARGRALLILVVVLAAGAASLWQTSDPAAERSNTQRRDAAAELDPEGPVAVRAGGRPPSFADKGATRADRAVATGTTTVIASFDFEDGMGGADAQGWQSRDATAPPDTFFHVDDFSGLDPEYAPLSGTKSLWCGRRNDTSSCSFATWPGYGNEWDQFFQSVAFPTTGPVSLSYDIRYDTEPGYDYVYVDYLSKTGNWNTLDSYNGAGTTSGFAEVPAESLATNATFRFHLISDFYGSDEDGIFPSDGAVVIDNIVVSDTAGVVDTQDFEGEAVGALVTADGDWFADIVPPFGDYSGLFDGSTVLQEDSLVSNTTHLWGFFNGSPDNYGCGGHPEQLAVPYSANPGSEDERHFIHNDVYSPLIDITRDIDGMPVAASPSYVLSFDVYSDLPLDNTVVYDIHVRSFIDGCFTRWNSGALNYGDLKRWIRPSFELEDLIWPGATEIQVAIGVRDMCWYWCDPGIGTGACHSHAPLIDNVTVTVPTGVDTFVVTNTDETGPGSLQWAVHLANGIALASVVEFDIPGSPPHIIPWHGARLEYRVAIDATTQPGYAETPLVYLEDDRDSGTGFILWADSCAIRGLGIENTSTSGAPSYVAVRIDGNAGVIESCDLRVAPGASNATLFIYFGSDCVIGGSPETANRIETGYDKPGVYVSSSSAVRNTIRFNSIISPLSGAGLAIDLNPWGVTANDTLDLDFGTNYRQNYPVLTGYSETTSQVVGYLNSWVSADYDIDLYANALCDPSGYGDAELYIGSVSVTTDGAGDAAFTVDVAPRQGRPYLTATATDTLGNTSELSLCLLSINTPVGSGVVVMVLDSTGASPVTLEFDNVSTEGNTWLELSESGPEIPGSILVGDPTTYYDLETDAVYTGNIEVCVTYDEDALVVPEDLVRILHWDTTGTPDQWVDITTSVDTMTNVVCGMTAELSPFVIGGGSATGIDDDAPSVPTHAALYQNTPNPFNPTTTIRYDVPAGGAIVDLAIYDVAGRLVKRLASGFQQPGARTAVWDGRNGRGQQVATGVYFYRLHAGTFVSTRKMVLLK